jgi:putative aldouronate transport system substrate-binding protein
MFKKILSVFIAVLMILSFAACAPKQSSQQSQDKTPDDNKSTETDWATVDLDSLDPFSEEYDIAVEEKALAECTTPDYFKNTPTYEYTVEFNWAPFENSFGQRYFEKKFNVKLNYMPVEGSNRQEMLSLQIATGNIPDVAKVTLPEVSVYAKQGILAELSEDMVKKNMPGYYEILMDYDPNLLKYTRVDGKNYGLALLHPYGGIPKAGAIRSDWLKNVGINKVPTTIDELGNAFLKFRHDDPDQNGKKDTFALSCPSDWPGNLWFQSIFGAYGTNPFIWIENDKGELEFGFTKEETKQALKLLQKWYSQEIIDPEFITDKARSSDVEDVPTKFAKGKIGYLDHLNFDDHQWDNDGHISFRWTANHPEWADWFEKNKDDVDTLYSTAVFTDFDDSVPQPIFISMPPVEGPKGDKGYFRAGYFEMVFMFGKQLEEEPERFEKLLRIFEHQNQDEETYLILSSGPEGQNWYTDENGVRLLNPDWSKHKHFHPEFKIVGTCWNIIPMYWTNPDYLSIVGGPRAEQRKSRTADIIQQYDFYEDKVKVALPSQTKYSELLDTRIKEYMFRAISGDINIDETYDDAVQRWFNDGGDQLTREANEWYNTLK